MATSYATVTINKSTVSTTFADLLSAPITTAGGDLDVFFSASGNTTVTNLQTRFRLMVDGVAAGCGCTTTSRDANSRQTAGIVRRVTGLSAGAHTVKIQWCLGTVGSNSIDVLANPDLAHGSLLVREAS